MTTTYSLEEILADFTAFERVPVAAAAENSNQRFLSLYSQCFAQPMPDTATVDEIKVRFKTWWQVAAIP